MPSAATTTAMASANATASGSVVYVMPVDITTVSAMPVEKTAVSVISMSVSQ